MFGYLTLANLIRQEPVLAVSGYEDEFVESKNCVIKDKKGTELMYGHNRRLPDKRVLRITYWTGRSWGPHFELNIEPSEENLVGFQICDGYNNFYRERGVSFRRYDGIATWLHYDLSRSMVKKIGNEPDAGRKMSLDELEQIEGVCAILIKEVVDVLRGKRENISVC